MKTMKAWRVHAWGEPEALRLENVPVPEPAAGQVRIRVYAAALNFFDILQIQGKYQIKPPFPFIPGAEISGVVDALGEGVSAFAPGERVLAFAYEGAFCEYALADQNRVFSIPPAMDFPEAAAFPIVYHTSYFALSHRTRVTEGEWLLVHAGASGVGMSAIQLGRAFGARVIATAGSEEKLKFCRRQGAIETLNYREDAWVERVKEITGGRGAAIIYDPVGGDVFDLSTKCIAPEGRLLVIGFASGRIPSIAANRVLLKNIAVAGVLWGGYVQQNPGYIAEAQRALEDLYSGGKIKPEVGALYPFASAPTALRDLSMRKIAGKTVMTFSQPAPSRS